MLESKLISIDPGKYATKAMTKSNHNIDKTYFRTKIFKLNESIDLEPQGQSFKVEFEGENYIVGEQGEDINYSLDKANINHKLAAYTAISQLLGDSKVAKLVLGCPTSIYKNRDLRNQYRDYILNNGSVKIYLNDAPCSFLIENILVLPEGSGIVYTESNLFKNKRVAVIDLGGLNMNFSIYDNLTPQPSSMFTINHGYTEIESKLTDILNSIYGVSFNTQEIQEIIRQDGVKVRGTVDPRSKQVIDTVIEQYIAKLIQEVRKYNFNLEMMEVVFVGGTSLLVENKIRKHIPHATIMKNAQWSNVEGFYKVGVLKYGLQ